MSSPLDIHLDPEAVELPPAEPSEAELGIINAAMAYLFNCSADIPNRLDTIRGLLINYYPQTMGVVDLPPCPISFIITSLYAFAEMKAQGSEFPFKTHRLSINVALSCLLLYALGSAGEHLISATRPGSV